jgi:hypothetical protein
MSNDISKATVTITCWGCNKILTKPYLNFDDCINKMDRLLLEGWVKRSFGPNVWSWFCSYDCAYNSRHAKQAEQWWHEHGKNSISWFLISAVIFTICCLIFLSYVFMR